MNQIYLILAKTSPSSPFAWKIGNFWLLGATDGLNRSFRIPQKTSISQANEREDSSSIRKIPLIAQVNFGEDMVVI